VVLRVQTRRGVESALRLAVRPDGRPWLRLVVQDGDDRPLRVTGVRATYRLAQLVIRAAAPGPHQLLVGRQDAEPPSYDLAQLLRRGQGGAAPRPLTAGPPEPNPAHRDRAPPRGPAPWTERYRVAIQLALGAVVLGLLIWTVLLMRRGRGSGR
jgi:hypothetical protein